VERSSGSTTLVRGGERWHILSWYQRQEYYCLARRYLAAFLGMYLLLNLLAGVSLAVYVSGLGFWYLCMTVLLVGLGMLLIQCARPRRWWRILKLLSESERIYVGVYSKKLLAVRYGIEEEIEELSPREDEDAH